MLRCNPIFASSFSQARKLHAILNQSTKLATYVVFSNLYSVSSLYTTEIIPTTRLTTHDSPTITAIDSEQRSTHIHPFASTTHPLKSIPPHLPNLPLNPRVITLEIKSDDMQQNLQNLQTQNILSLNSIHPLWFISIRRSHYYSHYLSYYRMDTHPPTYLPTYQERQNTQTCQEKLRISIDIQY